MRPNRSTRFNRPQRLTIGFSIAALAIIFFLHNPISGYTTTYSYTQRNVLEACSSSDRERYRASLRSIYSDSWARNQRGIAESSAAVEKEVERSVKNCHLLAPGLYADSDTNNEYVEKDLEFQQWGTVNPLVAWLKPLVHFIYATLIILICAAVFVGFVFREKLDNEMP